MPDMTLTDAQLAEIEARAKAAICTPFSVALRADGFWLTVRNGPNGKSAAILIDPHGPITRAAVTEAIPRQNVEDQLVVNDVPALVAALRTSRERERRVRLLANTWESQADGYPAEGHYAVMAVRLCARELRAALGEEATS